MSAVVEHQNTMTESAQHTLAELGKEGWLDGCIDAERRAQFLRLNETFCRAYPDLMDKAYLEWNRFDMALSRHYAGAALAPKPGHRIFIVSMGKETYCGIVESAKGQRFEICTRPESVVEVVEYDLDGDNVKLNVIGFADLSMHLSQFFKFASVVEDDVQAFWCKGPADSDEAANRLVAHIKVPAWELR